MQQVVDLLRLHEVVERRRGRPHEAFEWRLERASAKSPFTVVALADPIDPAIDVSEHVAAVKEEVAVGYRELLERGEPPRWMDAEAEPIVRRLLVRSQNGIARTELQMFRGVEPVVIDRERATRGISALEGMAPLAELVTPEREAYGEVAGQLVAVGRYRKQPALQLRTELYGFVWCIVPPALVGQLGGERTIAEVWQGKAVAVTGRVFYAAAGSLRRIEAEDVRETGAPPLDIETILDPEFTAGLEPDEYLTKLHEGELG